MDPSHKYFLSLGSNIQPEDNLTRAVTYLRERGTIEAISGVWESQAVGSNGPNFLNLCLSILSPLEHGQFKESVAREIEGRMGRQRRSDRSAPRPIDIDILLVDGTPVNPERWRHPFVIIPLAELLPQFTHPIDHAPLSKVAQEMRADTWMVQRAMTFPNE